MSDSFCYNWDNLNESWFSCNLTWAEACVINKITTMPGGVRKYERLTKEEKRTLIGLIVKIKQEDDIYKSESSKYKNKSIRVTAKDIQLFIKELREIKVKIIL